jgi:hypothetical protein
MRVQRGSKVRLEQGRNLVVLVAHGQSIPESRRTSNTTPQADSLASTDRSAYTESTKRRDHGLNARGLFFAKLTLSSRPD